MTVLCLTGWQQNADALAAIAPNAMHFDYSAYNDVQEMFAALPRHPALAVGWSLGGQLLARAVAAGHVKPEALILLGAPFQWMADAHFKDGIPAAAVAEIKENYLQNPHAMLKNLNALIALGDAQEKPIVRALNVSLAVWKHGLYWLDELSRASCRDLDFSGFPHTVIIHGAKDKVIYSVNAQSFKERLTYSELLLWPECAHAPHLHDGISLQKMVSRYV